MFLFTMAFVSVLKLDHNGIPVDMDKNTSILVDNSRTELKIYERFFLAILLVTLEFL